MSDGNDYAWDDTPQAATPVQLEFDLRSLCRSCSKELCAEMDSYYGKIAWLADYCSDCRWVKYGER